MSEFTYTRIGQTQVEAFAAIAALSTWSGSGLPPEPCRSVVYLDIFYIKQMVDFMVRALLYLWHTGI